MSKDDGDFIANVDIEPTFATSAELAEEAGEFKIEVSLNGVVLGWFTDVGAPEYWITVTPNEADATVWTQVTYNGSTYLKKSTNNYLSYRSNNVIFSGGMKMRAWAAAAKWELSGNKLKCLDNGNFAGRDGDKFYVNDHTSVVEVKFVSV
jgi:hypothetical protein